jgi:hypothetical protein
LQAISLIQDSPQVIGQSGIRRRRLHPKKRTVYP